MKKNPVLDFVCVISDVNCTACSCSKAWSRSMSWCIAVPLLFHWSIRNINFMIRKSTNSTPPCLFSSLTGQEKNKISKDVQVKALVENIECKLLAQSLTWNISLIDADSAWPKGFTGLGVKVAVVDTGINLSHPDLAANIKGNYNAINSKKSGNDDNGPTAPM